MNAFTSVRPRGTYTAPSKPPRKTNSSAAPMGLVLNCRGLLQAPLQGRTKNSITLEGQAAGRKSTDKRAAIRKGGI